MDLFLKKKFIEQPIDLYSTKHCAACKSIKHNFYCKQILLLVIEELKMLMRNLFDATPFDHVIQGPSRFASLLFPE